MPNHPRGSISALDTLVSNGLSPASLNKGWVSPSLNKVDLFVYLDITTHDDNSNAHSSNHTTLLLFIGIWGTED